MTDRILKDLRVGQSTAAAMGDMLDVAHSAALNLLQRMETEGLVESKTITATNGKKLTVFLLP